MAPDLTRRDLLKYTAIGGAAGLGGNLVFGQDEGTTMKRLDKWDITHDRVFLGGQFWTNPMEDWRVADGWASCIDRGGDRSIHSLEYRLTDPTQAFMMQVEMQRPVDLGKGGGGFRIGIRSDINELRSSCIVHKGGVTAAIMGNELVLGKKKVALSKPVKSESVVLAFSGVPSGDSVELTLVATVGTETLATVKAKFKAEALIGNVAVISQPGWKYQRVIGKDGMKFRDWRLGGKAFTYSTKNHFGPLLWSMYTLSDSRGPEGFVMKMNALTAPMGEKDNQEVELEIKQGGSWKSLGKAKLDTDAWTAPFRIPKWDASNDVPYRLTYLEKHNDGSSTPSVWTGTVKASPNGRPLRLAALTCQKDYGFPYEPVANNLIKLDPDMLYFSGDQLYENHGGFGIIRDPAPPAILNYLRKFYQFGWAFREAMRNAPTVCIPDDHDVFHGNIWGEGGASSRESETGGGYREPVRMVNAVHRTNCGHHPDYYDPTPAKRGMSVYYGDMVYGNVSFAILGDRQWKTGPEAVSTWKGRPDHVKDKNFDTSTIDKPGLELLGKRQEEFLRAWSKDWRGHTMKVLLSQTVFSAVATHHGSPNGYLKADLDSGGWPQTPRNRAIEIIREAMCLHVNGDQHLTTLSQYGVDKQRDGNWSFCTPAIAAGYPRWWLPDEVGMAHENRPAHGHANTGEFLDGFGNKVYVYAVGNPPGGPKGNRYDLAHNKASGFGLVTIDTDKKTYLLESFRFLIDATDGKASNQFPGWPVTIHQTENKGENRLK
jgi:phosphodiesterase/alkaline phosphatase D-like protein